jgi:hypothetical protein
LCDRIGDVICELVAPHPADCRPEPWDADVHTAFPICLRDPLTDCAEQRSEAIMCAFFVQVHTLGRLGHEMKLGYVLPNARQGSLDFRDHDGGYLPQSGKTPVSAVVRRVWPSEGYRTRLRTVQGRLVEGVGDRRRRAGSQRLRRRRDRACTAGASCTASLLRCLRRTQRRPAP